jgi:hypothetical protein
VEHLTWTVIDKALWGPGPWVDEPDKEQWQDEATGLACLVVRNRAGALCGYVGVPAGHPWFGVDRWRIAPRPNVHGGVNYSARCQTGPESLTVCHVADESESVWWLGFDCSHAFDLAPCIAAQLRALGVPSVDRLVEGQTYRDMAYVKQNCEQLARAASRLARGEVLS